MEKAIIGKKVGMSQIFDEAGRVIPVTVIEAGPRGPCFGGPPAGAAGRPGRMPKEAGGKSRGNWRNTAEKFSKHP